MPFQSEKQRKYLWANEPEIAREWTDKYGSRVKKQLGGILDIGYHGSPLYQDILSQGFKGGAGQSSRILGMNMPTWAGKGRTFVASNPSGAYRYGVPIEVAKSARNFTMPFGGGLDKRGISFAKETALNPKQATKGMNLMQKLRAGQYLNSPTAQRLLQTGTTAAPRLGILGALSSLGGQAATALPLAYTYGASKLQESLPMSLIGEGGLSDQNPYFGAMGVSVDPTVEETLRYGDDGKPSPDTGEGSTLAKAWDAIKSEFGGSAEAAGIPIKKITQDEEEPYDFTERLRRRGDFTTKYPSYNPWQMRAAQAPGWKRNAGRIMDLLRGPGGRLTPAQERANQSYAQQQRITRDPTTGRMTSGLFAGKNAPGTSMFGSKTYKEMAQKWALKNQHRVYKTPEMQQKKQDIIAKATGGRDPSQGNTVTGHGKSGMGRSADRFAAEGGLMTLWPR